jgi:small GTP-binding protein
MLNSKTLSLAGDIRGLLGRGLEALARTAIDPAPLRQALLDLDGPFLLVVAGEFNSGKSSLLNALLRAELLKEGVTPTTDRVQLIGYGPEAKIEPQSPELAFVYLPNTTLKDVRLVDTPGTNAIARHHQVLTERFLPRADLILFATSADRPFTQSEADFLGYIRAWGKKIVLIINKMDLLKPAEQQEVMNFVLKGSQDSLGQKVPVFGVSARMAKAGERSASGIEALEAHIQQVLNQEAASIKLGSPLGVMIKLLDEAKPGLEAKLGATKEQLITCNELGVLANRHAERTRRDFAGQVALVTQVLDEVRQRGERWLDEKVRLSKFLELINSNKLKQGFIDEVVKGANQDIEKRVLEAMNWLAKRDRELLEDALHLLREAPGLRHAEQTGPEERLIAGNLEDALMAFKPEDEAVMLRDQIQEALQRTALVEVGAVGVGLTLILIFQKVALDILGIFATVFAVIIGTSILPRRKESAKAKLRERLGELRSNLEKALGETLETELRRTQDRFTALYRQPCGRLEATRDTLQASLDELGRLKEEGQGLQARLG